MTVSPTAAPSLGGAPCLRINSNSSVLTPPGPASALFSVGRPAALAVHDLMDDQARLRGRPCHLPGGFEPGWRALSSSHSDGGAMNHPGLCSAITIVPWPCLLLPVHAAPPSELRFDSVRRSIPGP